MFTPTYIKMVSLAESIQKMRQKEEQWKKGDWFLAGTQLWAIGDADVGGLGLRDIGCGCCSDTIMEYDSEELTWLPLLHQLSEIFYETSEHEWPDFAGWCIVEYASCKSFEEAGLMVVMRLKYHLRWTGEGWEGIG